MRLPRTLPARVLVLPALLMALTACGSEDAGETTADVAAAAASGETTGGADTAGTDTAGTETAATTAGGSLTVYSGRSEEFVAPLLEGFEEESGVEVDVRYGESAELAATIAEEGDNSPADVFFAQDAGSLGAVAAEGLFRKLPASTLDLVDARFRSPDGTWVGTSGRARVAAYNTDRLKPADLPASVLDLTKPRWKGKVGIAPTNASFQAFVTALRLDRGDEAARAFLQGLKDNGAKLYEKNSQILEAVAAGEIEVGLVNNYYLFELQKEQPDAPVANHFFQAGDPGALVNAAGVGVLGTTDDAEAAEAFAAYLLGERAQTHVAEEVGEYPLAAGVAAPGGSPPLADVQGPRVTLGDLGPQLEATLGLLGEVGLTS